MMAHSSPTSSAPAPASAPALEAAAAQAIERALRAGAEAAEACVQSSRSFGVEVNGGRIEALKHGATRGLGLRVIVGGAVGFVSSNDLSPTALEDLARR